MPPIFLIGFMGVGKSTLGRALADATAMKFVDLDSFIESRQGRSISDIFAADGEAAFRTLESEALDRVSRATDLIVACGGGTPCHGSNMALMNARGLTVRLTAPLDVILRRLQAEPGKRPLVDGLDARAMERMVIDTLSRREPHYSLAAATFDASRLESDTEIADTVGRFINRFLTSPSSAIVNDKN